jgi:hypothetical protein
MEELRYSLCQSGIKSRLVVAAKRWLLTEEQECVKKERKRRSNNGNMIAEINLDAYESAHALGKLDSKWRKCFTHEHNIRRCFKCASKVRSLTAGSNVKQR